MNFIFRLTRYVKMYLLYNGQRIAKKKTHVKKRTLNPVFNESFVFEVPAAPNATLDHVSLELLVLDWDRVTKNEVLITVHICIYNDVLSNENNNCKT